METLKKGKLGNGNKIIRKVRIDRQKTLIIDEMHSCYIRYGVETNVIYSGEVPECVVDSGDDQIKEWWNCIGP